MKVGVVLNGGKSTRMGQDKAQLTMSGQSLLEHAKKKLQACSLDAVVESGSLEGIQDVFHSKGPVGGIYSVIDSLSLQCGDILLVTPNDMPALKERTMNMLLQTCIDRKQSCIFSRFYLPVAIYLDERHLAFASAIKEKKGLPLRELLRVSPLVQLDESSVNVESSEFININTPQDWDTFNTLL
jgi:molybdopterin-guanine dinucleotide biosynthesis protein A